MNLSPVAGHGTHWNDEARGAHCGCTVPIPAQISSPVACIASVDFFPTVISLRLLTTRQNSGEINQTAPNDLDLLSLYPSSDLLPYLLLPLGPTLFNGSPSAQPVDALLVRAFLIEMCYLS